MLYDNINKTFYYDTEDAMLVLGKEEFNKFKKSGDLSFVTMQSLKPQKEKHEQKARSRSFAQGKTKTSNKRVMCVETGETFDSIKECCLKYGYYGSNISACCNGKAKTAYGYHWMRYA